MKTESDMRIVVKIGTSSVTRNSGDIALEVISNIAQQVVELIGEGHQVALVSSGAIASGLNRLGFKERPTDAIVLRSASAVGQILVMQAYRSAFDHYGIPVAQLLFIPGDFSDRTQYLHARETLSVLMDSGVLAVINENDALSNQEVRYGDNDKVAALVANLIGANVLVLLTDQKGLFSGDPRVDHSASLIEEVYEVDTEVLTLAGGAGSEYGSGGMTAKILAARMASWSGVETVIASAEETEVLTRVVKGDSFTGTVVHARERRLGAKKVWIAFAVHASGEVRVDAGAVRALRYGGGSLLPAGVLSVTGSFEEREAVNICDADGDVFAKGIVQMSSKSIEAVKGMKSSDIAEVPYLEVVHRDNLVILK